MIKVTANYNGRRAEFWMPCSESEMHKCFEQLQISEEHGTSLFVQTVIRPTQLAFLEDAFVDMDELNFLAKRLNCFSDAELDTFYGMIRHKGFTQMKDLINATYNLDNYTLVQDFRHIAFVGRTHYHALHGRITETAEKETDFAKLGRDLLASGSGIITDYGMLFPNEGKIFDEVYDGQVFPVQYHDDDSLVDVRMDFGGKTEVVFLPNHPIAITKALRRLGADSIGDCELSLYDFSVDNPQWCERFREMIGNEDISTSQKNKKHRHGRPTCMTCFTGKGRSLRSPAPNMSGATAPRRSPSVGTCGFISTKESAAMPLTSSAGSTTRAIPMRWNFCWAAALVR